MGTDTLRLVDDAADTSGGAINSGTGNMATVEKACSSPTVALLSGGGTELLLESCTSGETLGSSQPALRNTRFSAAGREGPCRQLLQSFPERVGTQTHCPVLLSHADPATVPLSSQIQGTQPWDDPADRTRNNVDVVTVTTGVTVTAFHMFLKEKGTTSRVAGATGSLQSQPIRAPATGVTALPPHPGLALTPPPLGLTERAEGTEGVAVTWDAAVWVGQVPIAKLTAVARKTWKESWSELNPELSLDEGRRHLWAFQSYGPDFTGTVNISGTYRVLIQVKPQNRHVDAVPVTWGLHWHRPVSRSHPATPVEVLMMPMSLQLQRVQPFGFEAWRPNQPGRQSTHR
ncbi:hypothetical protein EYF80_022601 [Liparis tanakae]|uniref:Uncharacterized protein n=1 Tax=Liparis tanakae TaxID=230148 RepID=A0A4Z2HQD0_9TELE|nr:hypothetical protein EYF80_022601 [Liparis tanakae]